MKKITLVMVSLILTALSQNIFAKEGEKNNHNNFIFLKQASLNKKNTSVNMIYKSTYPVVTKKTPFSGSRFYLPNNNNKHTSVIMLHGSEGGSMPYLDAEANVLATKGYAVLVLCYFDCNRGLVAPRETLKNVEVSLISDATLWLRSQNTSNNKVVVYGFSRGAELTMIVGSLKTKAKKRPNGLIAHSPSDKFVPSWNWGWADKSCWICTLETDKCSSREQFKWNPSCGADNNPALNNFSKSAWLINGKNIPAGKRIEIENFEGPILITVGELDKVWPADQTKRIEKSLIDSGRKPIVKYFPNAGHVFSGLDEKKRKELVLDFLFHLK